MLGGPAEPRLSHVTGMESTPPAPASTITIKALIDMKPARRHCNVRGPLSMSTGVVGAWLFTNGGGFETITPYTSVIEANTPDLQYPGDLGIPRRALVVSIRGGQRSQLGAPVVPGPTLTAWASGTMMLRTNHCRDREQVY